MAKSRVTEWNGDSVLSAATATVEANMRHALLVLENKTREKLGRRNAPRKRVGKVMRGLNPSKEGESPKVVTGTLRANVGSQVVTRNGSVCGLLGIKQGDADKYARRLELGFVGRDAKGNTVQQGERPFLRPVIAENAREIFRMLKGGK